MDEIELKLQALKDRGIFNCKLPDILVGSVLMRVDYANPDVPTLRAGKLHLDTRDMVEAGWFLEFTSTGQWEVTQDPAMATNIPEMLDKYNSILDNLMVIAHNGHLQ
jgi:hypothetical protein